jgi:hypothetical protein
MDEVQELLFFRADAGLEDFIAGESESAPGFFITGIKPPGMAASPAITKDMAGTGNTALPTGKTAFYNHFYDQLRAILYTAFGFKIRIMPPVISAVKDEVMNILAYDAA